MAARSSSIVLALVAGPVGLALGGCSAYSTTTVPPPVSSPVTFESPRATVAAAGKSTFDQPTLELTLAAGSPTIDSSLPGFSVRGPLEPGDGRFRVEPVRIVGDGRWAPEAVVGLGGEGFENTVEETTKKFGAARSGGRCWFNPEAPVGGSFAETISIEEAVRVTGSILESLGKEVESANGNGSVFQVDLKPSASRPEDDFKDTDARVWGDRNLLELVEGPILLSLSPNSEVERLRFRIRNYRPYYRPEDGERTIPLTSIDASLTPTEQELELDPPECQAIE